MPLLNVRLSPQDAERARALREAGIEISAVVRSAIRVEYDKRVSTPRRGKKPSRLVKEILNAVPDPKVLPIRGFDIRDRRATRAAISSKLRRSVSPRGSGHKHDRRP
jgi:hypothetical protein